METEKTNVEVTLEKSQEQANVLLCILIGIKDLEVPYLRNFARNLAENANTYDSMAALNRNWNTHQSALMAAQAKAAHLICDYKECLEEVDKLKELAKDEREQNKFIDKLFGIK